MLISECPFISINEAGEAILTIREGDKVTGETVATINLGDGMDHAEHVARAYLIARTNTRMGTSEANQARKIKAIRKAMGYTN